MLNVFFFRTLLFYFTFLQSPLKKTKVDRHSKQSVEWASIHRGRPKWGNYSPWIICAFWTLPALALCVALAHWTETEGFDLWPCHNRPPEGRWQWATMLMEPPLATDKNEECRHFPPVQLQPLCTLCATWYQLAGSAGGWLCCERPRGGQAAHHVHVVSHFYLIPNLTRMCVCVRARTHVCVHRWRTAMMYAIVFVTCSGEPTPPGCVGGDTLHSEWHAAGCPGLSRGSGGDRTMMCFMGINVDTHSSPYSTPATPETFGLVECRASSHFFCVHPFVFGLTVGPLLLPARSRMWTPASVSWTPEEWTYKGSQQKVRRKRMTQGPS